jgi:molecular chaperone DnaK (HSP70)
VERIGEAKPSQLFSIHPFEEFVMSEITTDIVGIDLGTTNSVIAIPGRHEEKGQVFGPVTVLFDEVERLIQSSSICVVDGDVLVGEDAKAMAEEGHRLVRFWKKYMGTSEAYQVGEEEWTPEQLSAAVLKHMVNIAEQSLGVKIRRAVITHPAYFDVLAINATREAAKAAGLDADGALQMEPVAAAMAYTYEDTRSEVRVLVYDLGGGTFDITLVERTPGKMSPTAFGGDRELGGYNFDKKIATRMLASLREKGYALQFDPDNPQKDARWTTLLYYAEQVKHKLTDSKKADIRRNGIFKDDSSPPKNVQLSFTLTEPEFRKMIEPEIVSTIEETRKVIEKSGHGIDEIHYLVLVGGSSRIPAVRERLEQEFGLEPQFDEDVLDLSVAAGAAMMAATLGASQGGVFLNHIPAETDAATLPVSGRVEASEEVKDPANYVITITGGASEEVSTVSGADGGFYADVELFEEEENELTISVVSPKGEEIFERTLSVTHNGESNPAPQAPQPPLPKPICVATEDGLFEMIAENALLPREKTEPFFTTREMAEIEIDIFQEDIQLSTLKLQDLDRPVPVNCPLNITVSVTTDYLVTITAALPSENVTSTQEVQLERPPVPTVEQLKRDFAERRAQYRAMLDVVPDGPKKARVAAEADKVIEEADDLFNDEHPERMQLYMLIKELEMKIKQLKSCGQLDPPRAEMDKKFGEARRLLPEAEAKDESIKSQDLSRTLSQLQEQADTAYAAVDQENWHQIYKRVDEICRMLKNAIKGGGNGGSVDRPPAPIYQMQIRQLINELRQLAAAKQNDLSPTQKEQVKAQLHQAETKLDAVDVSSPSAQQQLTGIVQSHLAPVAEMLEDKRPGGGIGHD